MPSRRQALGVITGAGAAAAVLPPVLGQTTPAAAKLPSVLSSNELRLLAELCDRILPRTDTPGASDAGVPAIIDSLVAGNARRLERCRAALVHFGGGSTPEARLELLERASREPESSAVRGHFEWLKGETIDAYYSTQEGLKQELGWNANTYVAEFKGCTHPEHQK